jgi:hyperosmotically inducible protein
MKVCSRVLFFVAIAVLATAVLAQTTPGTSAGTNSSQSGSTATQPGTQQDTKAAKDADAAPGENPQQTVPALGGRMPEQNGRGAERIAREVRHELIMLPNYSMFDNLAYRVDGETVTLAGQVTRPSLKSDAENVVKKIEGVEHVVNRIEVLPPSSMDDRIRLETARQLSARDGLYRYFMGAVPSIHIIVNGGRITLDGFVDNEGDRTLAVTTAKSIPGVFSVTDNLKVAQ